MTRSKRWLGALALAATLLSPSWARANGAFPFVSQLVSNAADPKQLVLRGNFGLVVTRDGGKNWDWLCEEGLGYQNIEPPIALMDSGVILLALPTGISRSDASWCAFAPVVGATANFVDVSVERAVPKAAVALSVDIDSMSSQVWESLDDGKTFAPLGPALPGFIATTLDVAASDPELIYVSGISTDGKGLLLRSDDHAQTFAPHELPSSLLVSTAPYISALDPEQPDTVYVRSDSAPGTLMVTRNGGADFQEMLRLSAPIKAFALSPDGGTVLAATIGSGVHRIDTTTLEAEKIACTGVWCFNWNDAGLFACGDIVANGFLVAASPDEGRTFEQLVTPTCMRGPLACADTTTVGGVCPGAWPAQRSRLGPNECVKSVPEPSTDCLPPAGDGGSAGADGQAGAATGGRGAGGSGAEAGGGAGSSGAAGPSTLGGAGETEVTPAPAKDSAGCGCKLAPSALRSSELYGLGLMLLAGGARRRRRSSL